MQVILLENILKLGKIGDQVNVKDGYGRNYLLKTGKALRANKENIEFVNKKKESLNKKNSNFVAVTVNPSDEFIKKNLIGKFDYIQLHGSETKNRVTQIKNMGFKIIKVIKIKDEQDINKHREFDNADIVLFDTPGMEKSLEFPKNLITKLPIGTKYALAGSISEDNIEKISKLGVNFFDLSSSLESQLGYKDHRKIRNFLNKINDL